MTFLKLILSILDSEKKFKMLLLFILMFIGMAFEVGGISLLLPTLTVIMDEDFLEKNLLVNNYLPDFIFQISHLELILTFIFFIIFYYLIKTIFLIFLSHKISSFAYEVKRELTQEFLNGYLLQDYQIHLKRNSSTIIRNMTTEVSLFIDVLKQFLILGTEGLVLIGITFFLFFIQPISMLIIFIVLGLSSYAFYQFNKARLLSWGEIRQTHEAKRLQSLQQGIFGIKEVKVYGKELNFSNIFSNHNFLTTSADRKQYFLSQLPRIWMESLTILTILGVIIFLIIQNNSPSEIIPILGILAAAAFRVLPSLTRIMHSFQTIRYARPVVDLIIEEFKNFEKHNLDLKFNNKKEKVNKISFTENIRFENCSFRYSKNSDSVLSEINILISKGETIGIIGESGSGKSTFVDLFMGLLMFSEGSMFVDGEDVSNNIQGWQKNIGYVPQSIYINDDTLAKNIAFGINDKNISKDKLNKAIKDAQLDDLVRSLEYGVDTYIGERGVRLSGGQIQRVGIARALYENPDVIVLDEASSALDSQTEKEIIKSINSLSETKTIVMIAHRTSTLSGCDRIFELSKGKIIRECTFEDIQ